MSVLSPVISQHLESFRDEGVVLALIWGSSAENPNLPTGDIDILLIKPFLRIQDYNDRRMVFGLPTLHERIGGRALDIFLADVPFIEKALREGHWTIISAVERGRVVFDDQGLLPSLRNSSSEFRALGVQTGADWMVQAQSIFAKAERAAIAGDFYTSVSLFRDSANALLHALLFHLENEPCPPHRMINRLRSDYHFPEVLALHASVCELTDVSKRRAFEVALACKDLFRNVALAKARPFPQKESTPSK